MSTVKEKINEASLKPVGVTAKLTWFANSVVGTQASGTRTRPVLGI